MEWKILFILIIIFILILLIGKYSSFEIAAAVLTFLTTTLILYNNARTANENLKQNKKQGPQSKVHAEIPFDIKVSENIENFKRPQLNDLAVNDDATQLQDEEAEYANLQGEALYKIADDPQAQAQNDFGESTMQLPVDETGELQPLPFVYSAENEKHQLYNQTYTSAYSDILPAKDANTNTIDAINELNWKKRGARGKRAKDGRAVKTANHYKHCFTEELTDNDNRDWRAAYDEIGDYY